MLATLKFLQIFTQKLKKKKKKSFYNSDTDTTYSATIFTTC